MADEKKATPFFTQNKKTLYAPKGAKFHHEGEEVSVQVRQVEKFKKLGYTESPKAPAADQKNDQKSAGEQKDNGADPKTMTTK